MGYTKLLEESAHLLNDLKTVVNENGLSMNDKERMDIIDRCYNDMLQNRSLVYPKAIALSSSGVKYGSLSIRSKLVT